MTFRWLVLATTLPVLTTSACGPPPEPLDLPADPAATGVPVGVQTFLVDDLTLEVWYPAPDAEADLATDVLDLREFIPDSFVATVGPFEAPTFEIGAVRDAPIRVPEEPYPVVFFSHGFGGFRSQSFDYVVHLASRGYVVVAADHPGRMLADVLPCLFEPALEGCDFGGIVSDPAPPHITAAIDWVEEAAESGFLRNKIDTSRLGLSGHSAGASSTARVGDDDPRLSALLMMAGGGEVDRDVPVLIMSGTCDSFATDESLLDLLATVDTAQLVRVIRAGHLAFSDICEIDLNTFSDLLVGRDDVNGFVLDLLLDLGNDGCPGGEPMDPPPDCVTESYLPLEVSAPIIRHYATVFFDDILRGEGGGVVADVFPEADIR